ncbi:MAG: hypothetical protein H7836_15835 [Magnetococcus sp. YQC-3]
MQGKAACRSLPLSSIVGNDPNREIHTTSSGRLLLSGEAKRYTRLMAQNGENPKALQKTATIVTNMMPLG